MAVNRDKVKKQMAESKQRSGKFRYLPKDATTALRILEFEDTDGELIFARQYAEHRLANSQGGKALGVCREETFGKPCAFCAVNRKAKDSGGDWEYERKTRYAVNAIDINDKSQAVRVWMLPVTAYEDIAGFVMDEEYADILEQKPGLAFNCKREGSGLDTSYSCKPQRNAWPVSAELMKQVKDPTEGMGDPGLAAQCEQLGYEMSDLFDDSEIETAEADAKATKGGKSGNKAAKSGKSSAKKSVGKKKKKPALVENEPELGIGSAVLYEDEDVVYHVAKIDGDDVEIEDADGEVYEATLDQIKLIEADDSPDAADVAAEEVDVAPVIEIGSEVKYLEEDDICTVKKINGDDVVIEDADGEQFDCTMEDISLSDMSF